MQQTITDNDSVNISSMMNGTLITDMLKATSSKHPVLQRLSAKLNNDLDTGNMISRYDRMYHRHNRN